MQNPVVTIAGDQDAVENGCSHAQLPCTPMSCSANESTIRALTTCQCPTHLATGALRLVTLHANKLQCKLCKSMRGQNPTHLVAGHLLHLVHHDAHLFAFVCVCAFSRVSKLLKQVRILGMRSIQFHHSQLKHTIRKTLTAATRSAGKPQPGTLAHTHNSPPQTHRCKLVLWHAVARQHRRQHLAARHLGVCVRVWTW